MSADAGTFQFNSAAVKRTKRRLPHPVYPLAARSIFTDFKKA
jgi:hypothetical protein